MGAFEWERGEATPEMLDFYRRHVGLEYECEGWITEASRDAIRHFAEGVGDDNPLYLDPAYAAASPYGGLIAPPTFPDVFSNKGFTADDGFRRGPLPGLFGLWAADRWEFHQPVRLGDTLRSTFRMDSNSRAAQRVWRHGLRAGRPQHLLQPGGRACRLLRHPPLQLRARGRAGPGQVRGDAAAPVHRRRDRGDRARLRRGARPAAAGPNRSIGRTLRRAPPSRPSSRGRSPSPSSSALCLDGARPIARRTA